jgi:hypothetical protein
VVATLTRENVRGREKTAKPGIDSLGGVQVEIFETFKTTTSHSFVEGSDLHSTGAPSTAVGVFRCADVRALVCELLLRVG